MEVASESESEVASEASRKRQRVEGEERKSAATDDEEDDGEDDAMEDEAGLEPQTGETSDRESEDHNAAVTGSLAPRVTPSSKQAEEREKDVLMVDAAKRHKSGEGSEQAHRADDESGHDANESVAADSPIAMSDADVDSESDAASDMTLPAAAEHLLMHTIREREDVHLLVGRLDLNQARATLVELRLKYQTLMYDTAQLQRAHHKLQTTRRIGPGARSSESTPHGDDIDASAAPPHLAFTVAIIANTPESVQRRKRRLELRVLRGEGPTLHPKLHWTQKSTDDLIAMRKAGKSYPFIATMLGRTAVACSRKMDKIKLFAMEERC